MADYVSPFKEKINLNILSVGKRAGRENLERKKEDDLSTA